MSLESFNKIVGHEACLYSVPGKTRSLNNQKEKCLRFCILQNATTKTRINAVKNPDAPIPDPVPLYVGGAPNNGNVSQQKWI